VVTVGLSRSSVTFEASAFHGRESDEDRIAMQIGALDSWSGRVSWRRAGWHAQVSTARLEKPEAVELTDLTRITASIGHDVSWSAGNLSWLFAWGYNHGRNHREHGWLLEGAWRPDPDDIWYLRAEVVDKNILTAGGLHPPGFEHEHVYSRVAAATVGYERLLRESELGRLALGADLTLYRTPASLVDSYGRPVSVHLFLRAALGARR
jgi:hypothetical protein